jgi:hypothetical protein
MCDYSLHHVASRPAKVSDKLVTMELGRSSTRGFAAVGELGAKLVIHDRPPNVAVCLLPGTELAFNDEVRYDRAFPLLGKGRIKHKVARFREIEMNDPPVHFDALEFPNGQVLKLTRLVAGQSATVLQLPVPTQRQQHVETRLVRSAAASRLRLDRVSRRPGIASILVPNQGAVMLWETLRSMATTLSTAFAQSFRRLKAHNQHPILRAGLPEDVGAEDIEATFKKESPAVRLPKKFVAQKPEKKIEVNAAA